MKDLVALFTSQLAEALNIGKNASLSSCDKEIKKRCYNRPRRIWNWRKNCCTASCQ